MLIAQYCHQYSTGIYSKVANIGVEEGGQPPHIRANLKMNTFVVLFFRD